MGRRLVDSDMRTVFCLASLLLSTAAYAGPRTVELCHVTKGAPGARLLVVPSAAASAHLGHGDLLPFTVFADADGDGYGDPSAPLEGVCDLPEGFVADATDCDDAEPWVNPGVDELLGNGLDDDCDPDTIDDACVDLLKHCTSNRNRSPLLRTVCASEGTVALSLFEGNNVSFVAFGEGVTEVELVNHVGDALLLDGDHDLCSLGGNRGPWNDEITSVTVFVD